MMKRTGMGRAGLAAMAAGGVLAMAAPAAAEVVLLDCEVSIQSTSDYGGGRSSTEESGTWQLRLDTDSSQATVLTMPFVFRIGSWESPFKGGRRSVPLTASEEAYSFCIERTGTCGQQNTYPDGWYRVSNAHIDRRRGVFRVSVDSYHNRYHVNSRQEYSGTCQRAPEQQF